MCFPHAHALCKTCQNTCPVITCCLSSLVVLIPSLRRKISKTEQRDSCNKTKQRKKRTLSPPASLGGEGRDSGGHFHIVMTHDGRSSALRDQGNGNRMLLEAEGVRNLTLLSSFLFFFFFFLKFTFFYLFIYDCVGSSFLCEGFLQLRRVGATLHHSAQASHYRGLSCCGAQAPDAQAQ